MRLVWKAGDARNIGREGKEVAVGDRTLLDEDVVEVAGFNPPHKPSSSGKVSVVFVDHADWDREFYVGVIGAEWIEREDRI